MNKKALEALLIEMSGHLQAALTVIEVVLMTGSTDLLPAAREEITASWRALETAAAPVLAADGRSNGEV